MTLYNSKPTTIDAVQHTGDFVVLQEQHDEEGAVDA